MCVRSSQCRGSWGASSASTWHIVPTDPNSTPRGTILPVGSRGPEITSTLSSLGSGHGATDASAGPSGVRRQSYGTWHAILIAHKSLTRIDHFILYTIKAAQYIFYRTWTLSITSSPLHHHLHIDHTDSPDRSYVVCARGGCVGAVAARSSGCFVNGPMGLISGHIPLTTPAHIVYQKVCNFIYVKSVCSKSEYSAQKTISLEILFLSSFSE